MGIMATALAGALHWLSCMEFSSCQGLYGRYRLHVSGRRWWWHLAFGVRPACDSGLWSGIIYIVEALSVVLQVTSFKLTGKRDL